MKKNTLFIYFSVFIYSCGISTANKTNNTQNLPRKDVPINPAVTIGQLDNGLTYYIHSNKKPENRAEMLLVVNAGSVLETDKNTSACFLHFSTSSNDLFSISPNDIPLLLSS